MVAEQSVAVALHHIQPTANQHRWEWPFAVIRHMQKTGDLFPTVNHKLDFFQFV